MSENTVRYYKRNKIFNATLRYAEILDKRGRFGIEHYATAKFIRPPLRILNSEFQIFKHDWKYGDSFWKLSEEHYGTNQLGWLIGFLNYKPTENHCTLGDTINIYLPLDKMLIYMGLY